MWLRTVLIIMSIIEYLDVNRQVVDVYPDGRELFLGMHYVNVHIQVELCIVESVMLYQKPGRLCMQERSFLSMTSTTYMVVLFGLVEVIRLEGDDLFLSCKLYGQTRVMLLWKVDKPSGASINRYDERAKLEVNGFTMQGTLRDELLGRQVMVKHEGWCLFCVNR